MILLQFGDDIVELCLAKLKPASTWKIIESQTKMLVYRQSLYDCLNSTKTSGMNDEC